jgi:hypothetical protein
LIVDHRTYTFRPGTTGRWLKKYENEGLAIQKKHLGHFLGLYTTEVGNLHQIVFMWGYDSMADREKRREALGADPVWQKYLEDLWAMDAIVSQEIKLLKPAPFSPAWK